MPAKPCRLVSLAIHPSIQVERCQDCGCVSVHLGSFTLRIDDEGLEALWAAMGAACTTLHTLQGQAEAITNSRRLGRPGAA